MIKSMHCSFRGPEFSSQDPTSGSSQPSVTPPTGKFEVTGTYPQNSIYNKKIEINPERKKNKKPKLPAAIDSVKKLWSIRMSNTQEKEVRLLSRLGMPRAAVTQLPEGSSCQFLTSCFRRGLKGSEGEIVLSLLLDFLLQMDMQTVLQGSFPSF